jgi:phage terminase Nu1 subunit (DNA packaging protein)
VPAVASKPQEPRAGFSGQATGVAREQDALNGNDILNSWKEIAGYLGRGLRTAQRWERELGLPVRRPRGRSRTAVFALRKELDSWLHDCPRMAGREEENVHSHDVANIDSQMNTEQIQR